ncbi:N2227-domain-containing protein [Mycena galericulata]|nr:N2227-domain-containing protein [Mycena galericulata]
MAHSHSHDQADAEEEQLHFANVIATFQNYAQYSLSANNRRRKDFFTLPKADQELLAGLGYKDKLDKVDAAIVANAEFLAQVVAEPEIFGHDLGVGAGEENGGEGNADGEDMAAHPPAHSHTHSHSHSHGHGHGHPHAPGQRYKPTDFDMDKLRSTLKQFVRDWSEEGREERDACYTTMIGALLTHFAAVPRAERPRLRVLVPGAGLGRLAHDVAALGFTCQGNEFSHYMLLASHFILNRTPSPNLHTLYPYIHSFSNVVSAPHDMLRAISIPDIVPGGGAAGVGGQEEGEEGGEGVRGEFSLVAGDFEEIYGAEHRPDSDEPQAGQWDAVLTCFFIDTAKNIVSYLRIIHKILKPGGVWVNMGPLLWHWENNTTGDPSVELSLEEVKALARALGFVIYDERTIPTTYTSNREGMLGYVYRTAFWVARKAGEGEVVG